MIYLIKFYLEGELMNLIVCGVELTTFIKKIIGEAKNLADFLFQRLRLNIYRNFACR